MTTDDDTPTTEERERAERELESDGWIWPPDRDVVAIQIRANRLAARCASAEAEVVRARRMVDSSHEALFTENERLRTELAALRSPAAPVGPMTGDDAAAAMQRLNTITSEWRSDVIDGHEAIAKARALLAVPDVRAPALPDGWSAEPYDDGYDTFVRYYTSSGEVFVWSHPNNAVSARNATGEDVFAVLAYHLSRPLTGAAPQEDET
jgi:hypothetical protein